MKKELTFKNPKSVKFSVQSFSVPIRKRTRAKHKIIGAKCVGFTAAESNLAQGHGIKRLSVTVRSNLAGTEQILVPQIVGRNIKHMKCFNTLQGGELAASIFMVTDVNLIHFPLFKDSNCINLTPFAVDYRCLLSIYSGTSDLLFAGSEDGLFACNYSYNFQLVTAAVNPVALCYAGSRVFALDKDGERIFYSSLGTPDDFDGSCITIDRARGRAIGLEARGSDLIVVQQFGFTVVNDTLSLNALPYEFEEIIPNTARVIGNDMLFLTKGGCCLLSGKNVTLLGIDFSFAEVQNKIVSIVYDNKYYLAFKDSISQADNNTLLIIDKFRDSYSIIEGINIRAFERIWNEHGNALAVLTTSANTIYQLDTSGTLLSAPTVKSWESTDFSLTYAAGTQCIKQIFIRTSDSLELTVISNKNTQTFHLQGETCVQQISLNLKGETFRLKITSNNSICSISDVQVVVGFGAGG